MAVHKAVRRVALEVAGIRLLAELDSTPTADAVWNALPIHGRANRWGDEIYFGIPPRLGLEPEAREAVKVGDLGYWPPGHALCLFFGPTPISDGNGPRAASPVNVFGRLIGTEGDAAKAIQDIAAALRRVPDGAVVTVTAAENG